MRAPSSLYSNDALAERAQRVADAGGRIGKHRLHRLERLEDELPERRVAFDERRARNGREIAGKHGGLPNAGERNAGRARDRVHQHAFERALPQLAEQEADQKVLLVARGAAHELAHELRARRGRAGARRRRDGIERRVHVAHVERRRAGGRHVAERLQLRVADANPPLSRVAAQIRDDDRELIGRDALQQIGEVRDLLEAAGRRRHRRGHVNEIRKTHSGDRTRD
jgi:hypothetical protein